MTSGRRVPDHIRLEIRKMARDGTPYRIIAKKYNISRDTLYEIAPTKAYVPHPRAATRLERSTPPSSPPLPPQKKPLSF